MRENGRTPVIAATAALSLLAGTASATWSIVMVDTRTGEMALGSATCRVDTDLQLGHPVLLVGKGIAAAQATVDLTGYARQTIRDGFEAGVAPAIIVSELESTDPLSEERQFGIIDVRGRFTSYTGNGTPDWSGGLTGRIELGEPGPADDIVYAIQGNVLAGQAVVLAVEAAIRAASGDLADRLLAGMQAARLTGGDGRCSCGGADPTGCGAPPNPDPDTFKSAHIGYLMISRAGDTDGPVSADEGYATGDYWLNLNVAYKGWDDPDPVDLLSGLFDDWRASNAGRADAVLSTVTGPSTLSVGGETTLRVDLRAYPGVPVTVAATLSAVAADPSVLEVTSVSSNSSGFDVTVRGVASGRSELRLIANDSVGPPVELMPATTLTVGGLPGDLNGDGLLDHGDIEAFLQAFVVQDPSADLNGDSIVESGDIHTFVDLFTGG